MHITKAATQKLERPRSLSLQQNEETIVEGNNRRDIEGEGHFRSQLDNVGDDFDGPEINRNDSLEELRNIEQLKIDSESQKHVHAKADGSNESKMLDDQPQSARKTPSHLTDQGFFDLKFYHNKLW